MWRELTSGHLSLEVEGDPLSRVPEPGLAWLGRTLPLPVVWVFVPKSVLPGNRLPGLGPGATLTCRVSVQRSWCSPDPQVPNPLGLQNDSDVRP